MENARTDAELVDAARAGDRKSLEELLVRHEREVFRFGLRMCGDEDAARDVLQETLLAAFKGLNDFRGDSRISTWLYQIARSFCSKARRRGAGEPAVHEEVFGPEGRALASEEPEPDEQAHQAQLGQALKAAIAALPEASREVVVLRDVEGLSAEEAARIVGVDVGALKSRLHRARLELRGHLSRLLDEKATDAAPPCPALAQELAAYVTAEIDQSACAQISRHLASCPRCEKTCADLAQTVSLCAQLKGVQVPEAIARAVRHAVRSAIGLRPPVL